MSGDVFGNGMLLSEHIRLVAAFDHRHIFIDPHPDAATSYAERRRLFELPRSSWADYDSRPDLRGRRHLPASAKSIPLNAHIRAALGIEARCRQVTPADLMKAILQAPVDLLWNGGIGTYVKASPETHADVGDKANDAIRVDGGDLRVKFVGEGGNLGLTQLGRIEFAQTGRRQGWTVNTDAIDNSAGVDTSDHEVNIKILLNGVVADGDMTVKQRNKLLAEMTDEVAQLVLRNNYEQNLAIANAVAQSPACSTSTSAACASWSATACWTGSSSSCPPTADPRAAGPRRGADRAGAGRAARLHQDHGGRRAARLRPAGRPVPAHRPDGLLPDRDEGRVRAQIAATRCAARSSSPSWSTTWSTAPG